MSRFMAICMTGVLVAVLVSGCGGGGGSRAPMTGSVEGGTPMTGDEGEFILPSGNAVDSLLASDAVGAIELSDGRSGSVRADLSCRGSTCTLSSATARVGNQSITIESEGSLSVSDLGLVDGDWPSSGFKRINGVEFFSVQTRGLGELGTDFKFYGGWLDHQFFVVLAGDITSDDEDVNVRLGFGMSLGDATGTNPISGSATWRGAMVGADVSTTDTGGNLIEGNAEITIADFSDPKVGVEFTNVRDLDAGVSRSNMTWSNLPLTAGGFGTGSDGNSIQGKFYGPNHEEVGGIFERSQIVGAFGAKR